MPSLHPRRRGLSLLDPVVGALLLGVGATALLPRLVELQEAAHDVALQRLASTASQAMAVNQMLCRAGQNCQPVHDCRDLTGLLVGGLPTGHVVLAQPLPAADGADLACTLEHTASGRQLRFAGWASGT